MATASSRSATGKSLPPIALTKRDRQTGTPFVNKPAGFLIKEADVRGWHLYYPLSRANEILTGEKFHTSWLSLIQDEIRKPLQLIVPSCGVL